MLTNHPWIHFSTGFDLDVTAPGLLWIFGEEGNRGFCMMFFDATPNRSATLNSVEEQIVQDAKRIFPEAHISGVVLPFKLPPTSSTESNDNE